MTYNQLVNELKEKRQELKLVEKEYASLSERFEKLDGPSGDPKKDLEYRRVGMMRKMTQDRLSELRHDYNALQVEYHKKFSLSFIEACVHRIGDAVLFIFIKILYNQPVDKYIGIFLIRFGLCLFQQILDPLYLFIYI